MQGRKHGNIIFEHVLFTLRGNAPLLNPNNLRLTVINWWRALPIVALFFSMAYCQPKLLVCIPGKQNTQFLQKGFDKLLGPGKAIVIGKIKDLEDLLPTNPDAAIISSGAFFNYVSGYTAVLVGKRNKQAYEKFFIVTTSKGISKETLSEKNIGILGFLIKDRLIRFVYDQFNLTITSLEKVNKEDDLLTMLGMEAADAIIISESQYNDILSNTKLSLTIIAKSKNDIGFAMCAAKEGKMDAGLVKALLKAPVPLLKELGIDSWEKP